MNNSSTSTHQCPEYSNGSQISYTVKFTVLFLIGVCGILGNLFIIILAIKYTARKNLHHLIVNIAVADTVVIFATFALEVPRYFDEFAWKGISDSNGNALCKILGFLLSVGMWQTLVSLFLITVERFRATKVLHLSQSYSLKQRTVAITACWLIVMILGSHELYQASVVELYGIYYCNYFDATLIAWNIALLCFATPLYLTIIILGIVTLRRLSKRQKNNVTNLSEAQHVRRRKQMTNAVKLVLSSLFLYIGCYLPRFINNILDIIHLTVQNSFKNFCYDEN